MILDKKVLTIGVVALVGVAIIGAIAASKADDVVKAVGGVNKGTPYAGSGIVGTLGNFANKLSGGLFQKLGSAIGQTAADVRENL